MKRWSMMMLVALFGLFGIWSCERGDDGGGASDDVIPVETDDPVDTDIPVETDDPVETEDPVDTDTNDPSQYDPNDYLADDVFTQNTLAGPLDEFAQCVTDSGAYLFGTSWDFYAEMQRMKFNRSARLIKFISCDDPANPNKLLDICTAYKIQYTPTWVWADGTLLPGAQELSVVAEATGCTLPEDTGAGYALAAQTNLAQCLTASGAIMYGTTWCSYCKVEKTLFGDAAQYLPYVECDMPDDPYAAKQECIDAGVEAYPTWIFGDDTFVEGALKLTALADYSDCEFPVWPDEAAAPDATRSLPEYIGVANSIRFASFDPVCIR